MSKNKYTNILNEMLSDRVLEENPESAIASQIEYDNTKGGTNMGERGLQLINTITLQDIIESLPEKIQECIITGEELIEMKKLNIFQLMTEFDMDKLEATDCRHILKAIRISKA